MLQAAMLVACEGNLLKRGGNLMGRWIKADGTEEEVSPELERLVWIMTC